MAVEGQLTRGRPCSSDGLALAGYTFQVLRSANPTRGPRGGASEHPNWALRPDPTVSAG